MVRKHDAARADPDRARFASKNSEHDLRRRAGDSRCVVMFGEPNAVVAKPFSGLGNLDRVVKRLCS